MTKCRTPNCNREPHGFSTHCQTHKQTLRRHGAPTQQGITIHELKPYVVLVEARKTKNADSEAWGILAARWGVVLDYAKAELQRYSEGRPGVRCERLAAHHLVTIGRDVEPWVVVRTCLAMYLMQDQRPRRFTSEAAFDYQLVRRVRGLTESNAGSYWDHETQKTKRVYRDIPPRVTQAIAQHLKVAFGAPGMVLAKKEREDIVRASDERKRLLSAMEGLA
ncbi:MAG: hypothetical protein EOO70_08195 [Myxococcaceae bacterium]|nr:MAG: hypothetical protein EOO70_08195 [Myxococcaceae bacterium]